MNYLKYWGLKNKCFENTRDPKFFYPSEDHTEALERLQYMIKDQNMQFGMLTGEIGCGKTLVKTVLVDKLDSSYKVVDIETSSLTFNQLLMEIVSQLRGKELEGGRYFKYSLINIFKEELVKTCFKERKHLVICLDEVQTIGGKGLPSIAKRHLNELRLLSNIDTQESFLMTFILVGQPELRKLVKLLPQLDQRISLRYHLNALDAKNTNNYIKWRLKKGGHPSGEIFTSEALSLIFYDSEGIPRKINRICKLALDHAFSLQLKHINEEVITAVVEDLRREEWKRDS